MIVATREKYWHGWTGVLRSLLPRLLAADQGRSLVAVNPILLHLAILGICDFFSAAEPVIRQLLPKEGAVEDLNDEFESFMVDLFMNGLRKH